jgi:hypothetical protein
VAFSRRLEISTNINHRSITASRAIHQRERKMAPSSSPSSSQQSSLYQYYTPIASNDSSSQSTSRALHPSTHQNIPPRRARIAIKRPLHPSTSIFPSPKKSKTETIQRIVPPVSQDLCPRRHERETLPRSLIMRGLQGQREGLAQRTLPKRQGC